MKNNNKNIHFFAIAALAATLMVGQVQTLPVYAEDKSVQLGSLIPDNVTIEEPVPLSDISLPDSKYGTLTWADSSSVPSERVQSYDVVFKPYDSSVLSRISGWDGESDAIYSSVTVVVNSIASDSEEEWKEDSEENYDENYDDSSASENENQENYDENQDYSGENENNGTDAEEQTEDKSSEEEPEVSEDPAETEKEEAEITEAPSEEADKEVEKSETEDKKETDDKEESDNKKENPTEVPTETPEVTEIPEVTQIPETSETPEATITPEVTEEPAVTLTPAADKDNIFDGADKDIKEDERSTEYEKNLTEEQQTELAEENHSCNGITVSGIDLPYYVQFRVASGDDYEFTNETEANVFQSYEFELWDLKNNTEYEVPDGEYVSVTVPVKAGYSYTIEHLLDSGAMETIVPSVDGSTMVFSTHSFSPFGIAGSKTLVGEEIEEDGYDTGVVTDTQLTPAADESTDSSADSAEDTSTDISSETDLSTAVTPTEKIEQSSETASDDAQNNDEDSSSSVKAVHTNDPTRILPFVILAAAAAAIIGVIVYLRKRKK